MSEPLKNKRKNKGHENLIPIKPGVSGNPKGRPKKEFCIPDILRRMSKDKTKLDPEKKITRLEWVCDTAFTQAEGGDPTARAWIADRMEGKAIDRIISRDGDMELIIE